MKTKKGLAVVIAAGLLLALTLASCGAAGITGAWHSEELNQALRFHDDGTVVIRTGTGDYEASYIFDTAKNKGVITLKGTALEFTVNGDEMKIKNNGEENVFLKGDMEVAAATAAMTEAPSATADEAPTEAPAEAPTDTASEAPASPLVIDPDLLPHVTVRPGIIGSLIGESVVGEWIQDNHRHKLIFNSDGTLEYQHLSPPFNTEAGNYGFDTATGEGMAEMGPGGDEYGFTVDGDVMIFDGNTFSRIE